MSNATPTDKVARLRRRRATTIALVVGSYMTDLLMLFGMSWTGAVPMWIPIYGSTTGLGFCLFFYVLYITGWSERLKDRYMVAPQMLAHSGIILAFMLLAPPVALPLLCILFIVFTFGSMYLKVWQIGVGSALIALGVIGVTALSGDRMALPTASWQQRTLCGIWFALILIRVAALGVQGAALRKLLARRNTELAAAFDKLEDLACKDELTGALNRRSLMQHIEEERQRAERGGHTFAVALLDIDHFKRVNDQHGHLVGDEVLRRFTAEVTSHMRTVDKLGRYGGEEFLLLLTAVDRLDDAMAATERVRLGVSLHDWAALGPGLKVTVSAGVALAAPGESVTELLNRTDQALYLAKREGRDRIRAATLHAHEETAAP